MEKRSKTNKEIFEQNDMWQEFISGITDNLTEVMKIIDDALCYGFEFKVENHKLYFREVAQLSTLSTKLSTTKFSTKFKIKY